MTFNYNLANAQAIHIFSAGKYVDRDIVVNAPSLKGVLWTKMDENNNPEEIQTIGLHTYTSDMHKTSHDMGEQMGNNYLKLVILGEGLKEIGGSAFRDCTSLESVTISDGVEKIGYSAFSNCSSLASVTIPGSVTSIGKEAFYNCTSLESAILSNGLTNIGEKAFYGCNALTTVEIQEGFDVDLNLSTSLLLDEESVENIIINYKNNSDTGTTRTLTLHPDVIANIPINLQAIAFNKGVTIAGIILPEPVYFIDDTATSWIANDNATMYALNEASGKEYEMVQVEPAKWVAYIAEDMTTMKFIRRVSNQNALTWDAKNCTGSSDEYHALGRGINGGLWIKDATFTDFYFTDATDTQWVSADDAEIEVSIPATDSNNGSTTVAYFLDCINVHPSLPNQTTYLGKTNYRLIHTFTRYVNDGSTSTHSWRGIRAANTLFQVTGTETSNTGSWVTMPS